MPAYKKNPIRLISAVVMACFLIQEAAFAAPVASAGSAMPVPPPMAISQFIANPSQIQMPLEQVTVQEIHAGTNGKLIIHIQDAHANLSGQQSLAKALDQLLTKYDLRLVLVEGSARDSSLDEIRKLAPLKEWSIIARRFLYEGIISGEEYLNLTTEHPMKIIGVEYRDLYDEAVKAYAAIVDRRKDILHYLYQAKISLDRLKVKMYPREIKDYEAGRAFDDSGSVDFKNGFSSLLKLAQSADYPLTDLPQVRKLQELMEKESSIAFDKANAEQAEVLKGLGERGAVEEAKEFVEASRRTRFSQVSQYMLLSKLMQTAEQKQMALESFPELKAYAEYLSQFTELKVDELMTQMEYLEDKVYEKLLPDDNARKVRAIDRFLGLLGNAYKLQMSSRDFKMFTFNEKDFKTESWLAFMNRQLVDLGFFESLVPYKPFLEEARADFGRFYQLVSERDGAFVENAKRIMDEQHENAAVLIAGGYHTAHLTELLRAEGTSYIVLTPVVTDTTDHERYEDLLLAHLKDQEKHLAASSAGKKDTAPYRAQNVATTKIPRGIRALGAVSGGRLAELSPVLTQFVDSRSSGARLSAQLAETALRLAELPELRRSSGVVVESVRENSGDQEFLKLAREPLLAGIPRIDAVFDATLNVAGKDKGDPTVEYINGLERNDLGDRQGTFDLYGLDPANTEKIVQVPAISIALTELILNKEAGTLDVFDARETRLKTVIGEALKNAMVWGNKNEKGKHIVFRWAVRGSIITLDVIDQNSYEIISLISTESRQPGAYSGNRAGVRWHVGNYLVDRAGQEFDITNGALYSNPIHSANGSVLGQIIRMKFDLNAPDLKLASAVEREEDLLEMAAARMAGERLAESAWPLLRGPHLATRMMDSAAIGKIFPEAFTRSHAGARFAIENAAGSGLAVVTVAPTGGREDRSVSSAQADQQAAKVRAAAAKAIHVWTGGETRVPGIVNIVLASAEPVYLGSVRTAVEPLVKSGMLIPIFSVITADGSFVDVADAGDATTKDWAASISAELVQSRIDTARRTSTTIHLVPGEQILAGGKGFDAWDRFKAAHESEANGVMILNDAPAGLYLLTAALLSMPGGDGLARGLWSTLAGQEIPEKVAQASRAGTIEKTAAAQFALSALKALSAALEGLQRSLTQALQAA